MEGTTRVLQGWGLSTHARSLLYRPSSLEEVWRAVEDARTRELDIGHRGAGQSYGDVALNQGGALLELTGLDSILSFDADEGRVRAEAGVTIDQLWRAVIEEGWWPPVVPGTSRPTLGGCAAANIHGKNHWQKGTFGDHVRALTLLGPNGDLRRLRRSQDSDAVDRHLGALGLTGTIVALTLDLHRIHSGYLRVEARTAGDLTETLRLLKLFSDHQDYSVAWVDCFTGGERLGRSELHAASYLPPDHPQAGDGLDVASQEPSSVVQAVPPGLLRTGLDLALSDIGMQGVNAAKYGAARLRHPSTYLQPHAAFHFLLDSIPEWRRAYEPGGLLQYQLFLPESEADGGFRRALQLQHEIGLTSYLAVMKRHRRQPQADTYSVDGYSLALDFPVRETRLGPLMELVREFDRLQERAGGGVYGAKDAVSQIGRLPEVTDPAYGTNLSRRWERSGR